MDGVNNILEKVRKVLFEDSPTPAATAPVAAEAKTYKTKDGNEISIDKLEAGGMATAAGAPCSPGAYELEDGTIVEIGEGGIIASVKQPEAQAATTETPAIPSTPAPVVPVGMSKEEGDALKQAFEQHAQAFSEYKTANDQRFALAEKTIGEQKEVIQQLFQLVEQVVGQPASATPEAPKSKFSFSKVEDQKKATKGFQNALAQLQKTYNN